MTTEAVPAPPDRDRGPEFAGEFGWGLTVLLREWSRRVRAAAGDLPSGTRGYQMLALVVHDEPPTQAALAARLGVDRSAMTYLLDEYVDRGLLERRQDPADRRARRVVATELGRTTLAELDARVREVERELLSALPEPDRPVFHRLLGQAATALSPAADRCTETAHVLRASLTLPADRP